MDDRIIELLYRNLQEVFGEGDDHVSPPIQAASLYNNSVPQYAKGGVPMAKVQSDSVYRIIDVVGVSETSWVQQGYANRICTSLPSSLRIAWKGVLKPRHFLGVRLAVMTMS